MKSNHVIAAAMFTWMPWHANPPQAIPALLQNPCGHSQVTLSPRCPGSAWQVPLSRQTLCSAPFPSLLKVGAAVPPAGQPDPGWVINSFLPMKELQMPHMWLHKINPPWPSCQGIASISPPCVVDPGNVCWGVGDLSPSSGAELFTAQIFGSAQKTMARDLFGAPSIWGKVCPRAVAAEGCGAGVGRAGKL